MASGERSEATGARQGRGDRDPMPAGGARRYLRMLVLTLALGCVTLAVAFAPARYRTLEPLMLDNLDFAQGTRGWTLHGGELQAGKGPHRVLALAARAGRITYAGRAFAPPRGRFPALRVSAELRAEGIADGAEDWEHAGLILLSVDAGGRKLWWWPKVVARLSGDGGWRAHSLVVPLAEDIHRFWLVAYTSAARGTLWVRDIRLDGVAERGVFGAALLALAGLWVGLAAWVAVAVLRSGWRSPLRLASLALASAIIGFGVAPQPQARDTLSAGFFGAQDLVLDQLENATRWFASPPPAAARVEDPRPAAAAGGRSGERDPAAGVAAESEAAQRAPSLEVPLVTGQRSYWRPLFLRSDKDLHVIGFAVFALVTVLAWRQHRPAAAGLGLVAVSGALQALQSMTVTREPDLLDLAHDLTGIGMGLVAGVAVLAVLRRLRGARD